MKGYISLLLISSFMSKSLFAQSKKEQVFTLDNFIQQIKKYHPIARQGDIQIDKAAAELLTARGKFDPTVQWETNNKTFDSKNYYNYNHLEVNLPLPVGNLKAGLENNRGDFLFSEITKGRTSYLGLELPLVKGLLMDKRRAALQQAKIFAKHSAQERLIMLNNLLFESYLAYWQWAGAYQEYTVYSKFVEKATHRLRLVRIAFTNGDRALMDTTEAYTQLQNYQLLQTEALLKWKNSGIELSNYLWKENDSIYLLEDNQRPEYFQPVNDIVDKNILDLINQSALQNPSLKIYEYKLNRLEVDRKLKLQSLLPFFSIKANLLNKDYNVFKNINPAFIENNYKWGLGFKIPFFFREARGDYKSSQLKIKETNLDLFYKRLQTENKIRTHMNEYNSIRQQLKTVQSIYSNYNNLLRNEELKFSQGESSLFFVNTREIKLIEILQKQIELTINYYKTKYAVEYAAGLLR